MLIGSNFKQHAEKLGSIYIHYYLCCLFILLASDGYRFAILIISFVLCFEIQNNTK